MVSHKQKNKKASFKLLSLFVVASTVSFVNGLSAKAMPEIYSISKQFFQAGTTSNAVIEGVDLTDTVIGVKGGDIFAFILNKNQDGSLTVQFSVRQTAEPGERELFLRDSNQDIVTYPISIIPAAAPSIELINPSIIASSNSYIVHLVTRNLTHPFFVSTDSEEVQIDSFRESDTGLIISITSSPTVAPNSYHNIFVRTDGGTAQTQLLVAESESDRNTSSKFDPDSSWISSVEQSEQDENTLVLRGRMFRPGDTVTLLEDIGGTVLSRELETNYINNSELNAFLPFDVDLNISNVSLAVSSNNGKASNIKPYNPYYVDSSYGNDETIAIDMPTGGGLGGDMNLYPDSESNNSEGQNNSDSNVDVIPTANDNASENNLSNETEIADTNIEDQAGDDSTVAQDDSTDYVPEAEVEISDVDVSVDSSSVADSTVVSTDSDIANDVTTINETPVVAEVPMEVLETGAIPNLTQVLLDDDKKKDLLALNRDPIEEKIVEELDDVQASLAEEPDRELQNALKRTEQLKLKVGELEKVLRLEEQKNEPDLKKLESYKKLLVTANSESRSQTFELLNNLLKYKPELKYNLTQRPFDLAAIQPNIPDNASIIQYIPTDEGLIIFVVDKDNLKVRVNRNTTKAKLNEKVKDYRNILESEISRINITGRTTPISTWKRSSSDVYKERIKPLKRRTISLYRDLINPIESDLKGKNTIAIISNGWLRYLPFQSLAKHSANGELSFIIKDKSVVYLDSVLALSRSTPSSLTKDSSVTVIANPDGSLKGAVKEAEVIAKLFTKSSKIVEKPITKTQINSIGSSSDVLHLATHGFFDSSNIGLSYLVTGKKQIGKKTFREKLLLKDIYDLNLKGSKLVVLSGCDTGKLGTVSGEPEDLVGGLATAFRVAGANTIVASLWQAHDDATNIIMQNFYSSLKEGNDKAESLRQAQLKVMKNPKYAHPLFWSLFNLIGDWR